MGSLFLALCYDALLCGMLMYIIIVCIAMSCIIMYLLVRLACYIIYIVLLILFLYGLYTWIMSLLS